LVVGTDIGDLEWSWTG